VLRVTREAAQSAAGRRLRREERTIAVMVGMYCRDHHGAAGAARAGDALCADCAELLEYARRRLDACRFGADKPTCAKCPVHCYAPALRERVREVMRYSGPRMLARHPVLGVAHLVDGRRGAPPG
jgi:hypothetical protein